MRQERRSIKLISKRTWLFVGATVSICLAATAATAQMKKLGEHDGVRVIRQLDNSQGFQASTFGAATSAPTTGQSASLSESAAPGPTRVTAAEPVQFDTKRLDQSGGTKVYRELDKKTSFEPSTYKPKIYQTPTSAPATARQARQPIFRTQPKTYRVHRAGRSDQNLIITHSPGRLDQSKIITHGPGRTDESNIITHSPGRSDESRIVTHGPGRTAESKIITHRAGSFGYK